MPPILPVEYASQRKMRTRNTVRYRAAHWPIWIWTFFLAPGPLTFGLFERGGNRWHRNWLGCVMLGTGIAGLRGKLPGAEPAPYILRFDEDKPNPLYRRVCYTSAWNALLNFASLNVAGLTVAVVTGRWYLKQIYWWGYTPLCATIVGLGVAGKLPRAGVSTKREGWERRYFYGAVWSITAGQITLLILWKALPQSLQSRRPRVANLIKLAAYCAVIGGFAWAAARGRLPRTRPILPGEAMVAD